MKRNLIITAVFLIIASMIFLCNCTIYASDGSTCRGLGYECGMLCGAHKGCGASCLTCIAADGDIYDDYMESIATVAVLGKDYTAPTVTVSRDGDYYVFTLDFDVLNEDEDSPWEIYYELYFLQDGALVVETRCDGAIYRSDSSYSGRIAFNRFYDHNGGEISCIINSFALTRNY